MQNASLEKNKTSLDAGSNSGSNNCCIEPHPSKLTDDQAQEYANWFKVLADPTRIRILNLLACNRESLCVCDIVAQFDIGQPTISHHLKILREARFVTATRQGAFMYYSANRNSLSAFPQAAHLIMDG
jgi:ArsR family transcriptional regulator, arsenate/arsenite/antimonite-responsive transcriptional repressor